MSKSKIRFFPGTIQGRWSVVLIIIMLFLFFTGFLFRSLIYKSVSAGSSIPADLISRPFLVFSMLLGMASGTSGFITGIFAFVRKKDNAVLVYLSVLAGGFIILIVAGELLLKL